MLPEYDLVIRGGKVFDGLGGRPYVADVGIKGDVITEIGPNLSPGQREIDATGKIVTPGFVDIHTHYDGQVIWDERTAPSAGHGVTTIVMGNCGVGFAPCRPDDRDALIKLMEGVEDIPGVVMAEGLTWEWETFEEYLDVVESRARDVDAAAYLPHSCLRVYVMGQRGIDRELATEDDLIAMRRLTRDAVEAGAFGVGTSRILVHRSSEGKLIFSKDAGEDELAAIAAGMTDAGSGILQVVVELQNPEQFEQEFRMLERIGRKSDRPVHVTLVQLLDGSDVWRRGLKLLDESNARGVNLKAQVMGRPIGLCLGLETTCNPFSLYPTYRQLNDLPLAEKLAELRKPEVRSAILSEEPVPEEKDQALFSFLSNFNFMFRLGDPPLYEPDFEQSIGAIAAKRGITPQELAYDMLLEKEGQELIYLAFGNYADGNLDAVLEMMKSEHSVLGLGDGGAHSGLICDGGYPTFMLTYWTRDRTKGERIPLTEVVKWLSHDTAFAIGLRDRGVVAVGYKADLNVIDYEGLRLHPPCVTYDLPSGGRRLSQLAEGYVATILSGVVVYQNGEATGELPGRLVRGVQEPKFQTH